MFPGAYSGNFVSIFMATVRDGYVLGTISIKIMDDIHKMKNQKLCISPNFLESNKIVEKSIQNH